MNQDLGIGARSITISTVGVPNAIKKLASHKLQVTLAVSLHAPNQGLREQLIPSAKVYPIEALLDDCAEYFDLTGRRVSFENTLIRGVTAQPEHARCDQNEDTISLAACILDSSESQGTGQYTWQARSRRSPCERYPIQPSGRCS